MPIYPHGLPESWNKPERSIRGDVIIARPQTSASAVVGGDPGCSRRRMGTLLREARWGRFVFHGHVTTADAQSPTAAALVLAHDPDDPDPPVTTPDGRALEEIGCDRPSQCTDLAAPPATMAHATPSRDHRLPSR